MHEELKVDFVNNCLYGRFVGRKDPSYPGREEWREYINNRRVGKKTVYAWLTDGTSRLSSPTVFLYRVIYRGMTPEEAIRLPIQRGE